MRKRMISGGSCGVSERVVDGMPSGGARGREPPRATAMLLRFRLVARAAESGGEGDEIIDLEATRGEIRIGRRADLELTLPFPELSAVHARMQRGHGNRSGAWIIEDLGSTNGTFVDGERLSPGERRIITAGTRLGFASLTLLFEGLTPAPALGDEGTGTLARRIARDLFSPWSASALDGVPTLVVASGSALGLTLRLVDRDRPYRAGRIEDCELQIVDDEVSRQHAEFVRDWQGVIATDLGSKNGLWVNEVLVQEQRLCDGDVVRLGSVALRFSDLGARYLNEYEARAAEVCRRDKSAPGVDRAANIRADGAANDQSPPLEQLPHREPSGAESDHATGSGEDVDDATTSSRLVRRGGPGDGRTTMVLAALVLCGVMTLAVALAFS